MRIERGEHMSYPPKFEDIEACLRATHRQAIGPGDSSQALWPVATIDIGHWENCDMKLKNLIRKQTRSLFVFLG